MKSILATIKNAEEAGLRTRDGFELILSKIEAQVSSFSSIEEQNSGIEGSCVHIRGSMGHLEEAVAKIRDKADHTRDESQRIHQALENLSEVSMEAGAMISEISANSTSSSDIITSIDFIAREMGEAMNELQKSVGRFKTE